MLTKTCFLLLLGLLVHLGAAQDHGLGVRLDASLLSRRGGGEIRQSDWNGRIPGLDQGSSFFSWTSVLRFEDKTPIDKQQLTAIARDAHAEMVANTEQLRLQHKLPNVMAALKVGNTVYLGSSVKGRGDGGSLVYQGREGDGTVKNITPRDMADLLRQCVSYNNEYGISYVQQHKNEASCGEITALYQLYLDRPGVDLKYAEGSIVAWSGNQQGVISPCTDPNGRGWGCSTLTYQAYLDDVPFGTLPSQDYPRPSSHEQIELWRRVAPDPTTPESFAE